MRGFVEKRLNEHGLEARVTRCVSEALREVNALRAPDEQVGLAPDAPLFGGESGLDSLGLVNLAVALEGAVEREFGTRFGLMADMLEAKDPGLFGTVQELTRFAEVRVMSEAE